MEEIARNRMAFSYPADDVHAVLLTHAHNDHIGRLPALVRAGYRGPVFATDATADLAEIVLADSAHLQAHAAQRWARHHPEAAAAATGESEATVTETEMAAVAARAPRPPPMQPRSRARCSTSTTSGARSSRSDRSPTRRPRRSPTGSRRPSTTRVTSSARRSSSSSPRPGGTEMTIVFSGDLGRPDTPILRDPTPLTAADVVVVESTYGDREHPDADQAVVITVVTDVARERRSPHPGLRHRTHPAPRLAPGRPGARRIPHLPLFIDSPMACEANDVYLRHPEGYDAETLALLQSGDSPLVYPGQACTTSVEASKAIVGSPRPFILVAASGMLTGGRILHHLKDLLPGPADDAPVHRLPGRGTLGGTWRRAEGGASTARPGRSAAGCGPSPGCPMPTRPSSMPGSATSAQPPRPMDGRARYVTHGEPDAASAFAARIGRDLGVAPSPGPGPDGDPHP